VGTVGSAATLLGTLNSNVSNNASVDVEALDALAVGLEVLEEETDGLDGLFGPSAGVGLDVLALGVSLGVMLSETNDGLVLENTVHVGNSTLNLHALNSVGGVESVLEVGALVLYLGGGGLGGFSWLSRVLNHCKSLPIY